MRVTYIDWGRTKINAERFVVARRFALVSFSLYVLHPPLAVSRGHDLSPTTSHDTVTTYTRERHIDGLSSESRVFDDEMHDFVCSLLFRSLVFERLFTRCSHVDSIESALCVAGAGCLCSMCLCAMFLDAFRNMPTVLMKRSLKSMRRSCFKTVNRNKSRNSLTAYSTRL